MATRRKKKATKKKVVKKKLARRTAQAASFLKAMDPKSVVREGERSTARSRAAADSRAFREFKKLNPSSVVRESEFIARSKKKRKK
jgi:hypothetical protein